MLRWLDTVPLEIPAAIAALALAAGIYLVIRWIRHPRTPEERERRRRIHVHVKGRMTEATIHMVEQNTLHYSYQIAGVAYSASQDVTALLAMLPAEPQYLVGTGLAKYDPQNPANSIVVCEHWLGVRKSANASQQPNIGGSSE